MDVSFFLGKKGFAECDMTSHCEWRLVLSRDVLRYQNATAVRSDLSHLRISARCGCIRLARATYVADAISHHDDDQELLILGSS